MQWSKISLSKNTRTIINEKDGNSTASGNITSAFSYVGYAARLLTYQEVAKACGGDGNPTSSGELNTCDYLMENTAYSSGSTNNPGYWLETPKSNATASVYYVGVGQLLSEYGYLGGYAGIRPAIEVKKTDISY